MSTNAAAIEMLFEKAVDYSNTTISLVRLRMIEKTADVVSSLATQLVIIIVAAMFVFSISIAMALCIGEALGKAYYGFFVIAGCYALIVMLLYVFRNQWIKDPINNAAASKMLQKDTE